MGFMDKVNKALAGKGEQIDRAVDKAAGAIDEKTGGKHRDKIAKVAGKAKQAADRFDAGERRDPPGSTPPAP